MTPRLIWDFWEIFRKFNLVDVLINKMEKYAENLEEIVASRTNELIEEKKKTDNLLYKMLPTWVFNEQSVW